LSSGHVGMHRDETFVEHMLVFGMESLPEDGITLSYCHPTCVDKNLALSVELVLIIDNISFVSHALPGIFGGEVNKLLS